MRDCNEIVAMHFAMAKQLAVMTSRQKVTTLVHDEKSHWQVALASRENKKKVYVIFCDLLARHEPCAATIHWLESAI
ncbi:hypothetical protein Q3G72_016223 [Acer saccharum]|nr:hypothetical protein Q3G72_016223 [Acer saccharum]